MHLEVCVLTLNCWGIPYFSKDKAARFEAIANELATGKYDIVTLQEVWMESDFQNIKEKTQTSLPYSQYFYSGVMGSGVCIFSKFRIIDSFFYAWPVNGYMQRIYHGDWFGGKGLGLCRLKINNFTINAYTAHLHAEYDRDHDDYLTHRVIQSFNTARFVELTSEGADFSSLSGDFNVEPGDIGQRTIVQCSEMDDAYNHRGNTDRSLKGTIDDARNSYSCPAISRDRPRGKRLDYVMFKAGQNHEVEVLSYDHPLPDSIPGHEFSYSDHEAVVVKFKINKIEGKPLHKNQDNNNKKNTLIECVQLCDEAMESLHEQKTSYLMFAASVFVLLLTVNIVGDHFAIRVFSGFTTCLQICLTLVATFSLILALPWNSMETRAILAARNSMYIHLDQIRKESVSVD